MPKRTILEKDPQMDLILFEKLKSYIGFLKEITKGKNVLSLKERTQLENQFLRKTKELLKNMDKLILSYADKNYINTFKNRFRTMLSPWIYKGKIVKRGYNKPRGYPGDYLILEMIYDNKDITKDFLGRLVDRFLLEDSYVVAVRNRKEKMKGIISKFILNTPKTKELRFLNIASGGARDLRELLSENQDTFYGRNSDIVLVDQDKSALAFSKRKLSAAHPSFQFFYLNENISNFFRNKNQFGKKLGKFDMIYSIGLIDYISDFLLKELVRFSFTLLNNGGVLFFAVKNTKTYKSLASDWFCGWNFYLRDQKGLISIINEALVGLSYKIQAIDGFDKQIAFVSITKK